MVVALAFASPAAGREIATGISTRVPFTARKVGRGFPSC
jgi:hypothetical protein